MDVLDASRREADRSTHADDLAALESVAALHPDVATFEAWLRQLLNHAPSGGPAVQLSTIHKIKGREWGHVVIFGASAGLLPHRLGNDEEGERRVFHVALTRARRQVVALADAEAPSIFLAELDGRRPRRPPATTIKDGSGNGREGRGGASASAVGECHDRGTGAPAKPAHPALSGFPPSPPCSGSRSRTGGTPGSSSRSARRRLSSRSGGPSSASRSGPTCGWRAGA